MAGSAARHRARAARRALPLLLGAVLAAAAVQRAAAQVPYCGSQMSWSRSTSKPLEAVLTIESSWTRPGSNLAVFWGDGTPAAQLPAAQLPAAPAGAATSGPFADSVGRPCRRYLTTFKHAYLRAGVYNVSWSHCCRPTGFESRGRARRVGNCCFASDGEALNPDFQGTVIVDLRAKGGARGSPVVAAVPPTLFWHTGLANPGRKGAAPAGFSYKLNATLPGTHGGGGGGGVECAFASWRESGIMGSPPRAGGAALRLRGCELVWDAAAAAAARGKDYFVQVLVRPAGGVQGGAAGPRAQGTVDFLLSVV